MGNGSVIGGNLAFGMGWGVNQSDSSRKFPLVWGRFWKCLREWFRERFRKGLGSSLKKGLGKGSVKSLGKGLGYGFG